MRINNTSLVGLRSSGAESVQGPGETAGRSEAARASSVDAGSSHTPSPELVRLLDLVRQAPEVRQDVLERVAAKLAGGDYLTPEAAERTADAILKAQD